jgi:hypothetical protein
MENGVFMGEQVATKLSLAAKGNVVTLHLPGTDGVPEDRKGSNYKELPLEALLTEIRDSVAVMDTARGVIDREMRKRLLPALHALKEKTKRQKPGYYDHLRAMGLTVGRVKMWFHRAQAGTEIEALVEEPQPLLASRCVGNPGNRIAGYDGGSGQEAFDSEGEINDRTLWDGLTSQFINDGTRQLLQVRHRDTCARNINDEHCRGSERGE